MSRHRIVRNLDVDRVFEDYEDEEDDLEEEGDQLTDEDRIAMANGTQEVKAALGADASKVTVQQIQDALWHYFYDVEKSVTYLKKTYIVPAPKATPKKMKARKWISDFLPLQIRT
jgi:elongation factor 1 alpha-like protein